MNEGEQRALLTTLRELELALLTPAVRHDRARLDALLHDSFEEFGYSGSHHRKEDVLSRLSAEPTRTLLAQDFAVSVLAPGVALLTYRSLERDAEGEFSRHARRSSLWLLLEGAWELRLHQGTPTASFARKR